MVYGVSKTVRNIVKVVRSTVQGRERKEQAVTALEQ